MWDQGLPIWACLIHRPVLPEPGAHGKHKNLITVNTHAWVNINIYTCPHSHTRPGLRAVTSGFSTLKTKTEPETQDITKPGCPTTSTVETWPTIIILIVLPTSSILFSFSSFPPSSVSLRFSYARVKNKKLQKKLKSHFLVCPYEYAKTNSFCPTPLTDISWLMVQSILSPSLIQITII